MYHKLSQALFLDKAATPAAASAVAASAAQNKPTQSTPPAAPAVKSAPVSAAPAAPAPSAGALMTKALAGFGAGAGAKKAPAATAQVPAVPAAPAVEHSADCRANNVDKGIYLEFTLRLWSSEFLLTSGTWTRNDKVCVLMILRIIIVLCSAGIVVCCLTLRINPLHKEQ